MLSKALRKDLVSNSGSRLSLLRTLGTLAPSGFTTMSLQVALRSLAVACAAFAPALAAPPQFLGKADVGNQDVGDSANVRTNESETQSQVASMLNELPSDFASSSFQLVNSSMGHVVAPNVAMGPHCDCCNHEEKIGKLHLRGFLWSCLLWICVRTCSCKFQTRNSLVGPRAMPPNKVSGFWGFDPSMS
jgi:hypothetical protein